MLLHRSSLLVAATALVLQSTALQTNPSRFSRRDFVTAASTLATLTAAGLSSPPVALAEGDEPAAAPPAGTEQDGYKVFKTSSGLQYIELAEGNSPTPRYGQLLSIKYTGYLKLPNKANKEKFDSDEFLVKHGNGRTIAGLDEGLHTMREGGKRRIIIPPKLGFTDSALGPVPVSPFARLKLNSLLEEMVKVRGGNLIYDVELVKIVTDEADQGYYEDSTLTEDEFELLKANIQKSGGGKLGVPAAAENVGQA